MLRQRFIKKDGFTGKVLVLDMGLLGIAEFEGMQHQFHAVIVEDEDDEYIYARNSWGSCLK